MNWAEIDAKLQTVARIKDGIVVNLEVADDEWIAQNNGIDGYTFIPFVQEPDDPATAPPSPAIGYGFDPVTGLFKQPPTQEEAHE